MYKILFLILFTFSFSKDLYKEIRVYNTSIAFLKSLNLDFDHFHSHSNYLQFVINEKDSEKLNLNNINYDIIHEDVELFYQSRLHNNFVSRDFELGTMGGYYTHQELVDRLISLANDYPDLVKLISIGSSAEGRDIWAIKLSDNVETDENEPEVLYTGLHHSREPMSYMNLFYFMDWLLDNYSSDSLAQHLINNRELWFIPAINPDGLVYNQTIAPDGGGMQRKNMIETCEGGVDGIDLNRNYSYMWGYDNEGSSPDGCSETYRGSFPFSENETQAVKNFVESKNFPIALNYHSYSNLLIYPLGYAYDNPIPQNDLDLLIEYGEDMVQFNGYALGSGPELLYPVNGEACDWMYGSEGILAYTPEIGSFNDGFWPATERIIPLAEENLYPNQFLGVIAGSKYELEISTINGPFEQGNVYPLNISIFNQGMGDSNGDVIVSIVSSSNINFELEEINISRLNSRELLNLGDITYFSPINSQASIENITVNAYDSDGFIYSESIQIIIGQTELFIEEPFNLANEWTVGDIDDSASAGVWELSSPNPTYDDFGNIVQPSEDHSSNGLSCFLTENSNNPNSPGQSDVDGGKTTLFSPVYDLSDYTGAIVSYWNWYTNNQGNNPGNDLWKVDISPDSGNSWINLESTSSSNNFWVQKQFYINDYIENLESVKFRFIAEDIFYENDNGSGGSLVEAALDDFTIQVLIDNGCSIGDLNQDNSINIQDIVLMVNVVLGPSDQWNLFSCEADLNQDGLLNIQDIVLLVNLILR